jgi:hypothetical protein
MAFREMKDVFQFKSYVTKLREGLDASATAPQEFFVVESFTSDSQKGPMLLVGKVENKLVADIKAKDSKVYGPGTCMCDEKELKLTGPGQITDKLVRDALRLAKLNFTPVRVKEFPTAGEVTAAAQKGETESRKTDSPVQEPNGGPATAQAQANKDNAARLAPALLSRMGQVLGRFRPSDAKERDTFQKLHDLLAAAHKAGNADRVMSLVLKVDEATKAADARLQAQDRAEVEFNAARDKLRVPFDAVLAMAADADADQLRKDWALLDRLAAALAFADANASLKRVGRHVKDVKDRTIQARKDQIQLAFDDALAQLPKITPDEKKSLETARDEWAGHVERAMHGEFGAAETKFDTALEAVLRPRRQLAESEAVIAKVRSLWDKAEYKLPDAWKNKVNGYLNSLDKTSIPNRVKNGRKLFSDLAEAYKATLDKQALALAQAQADMQMLNQTEMEDQAATAYGDGLFTAGLVKDVWARVKSVRTSNPPNGSVAGTYPLATVEAALTAWRVAPSGVLTNFHMPGRDGGRPQAKWEKDFTRPVVEANFIVKWRGNKVNIHVDVEPRSFVDKYGDDLDWTQVPQNVREQLGRA